MKNQKREWVQKISKHYVGDDCIQIMIPHSEDSISILSSDGMTYHSKPDSNLYINKYITDSRKKQFPYSNIPIHKDKFRGRKIEYINQIYDFNRVYIIIADGMVKEDFVIKDGNEALLATKFILPHQQQSQMLTRQELEELFKSANGGVFDLDGGLWLDYSIPSDEQILNWYKEQLIQERRCEEQDRFGYYSSELDHYLQKSLDELTIKDVPDHITVSSGKILVSIQDGKNGKEINTIKGINVEYLSPNRFIAEIYDFPITIYSLEHMKQLQLTSYKNTPEPKFSRFLNSKIDTDEVKKEKQKVLSLREQKN